MPGPRSGQRTNSVAMLILAAILFGLSYAYGISVGMDRILDGALDSRAQQIASAISDVGYGLDLHYALDKRILAALTKGGMSDVPANFEPLGLTYPNYLFDTERWNSLLDKAAHLPDISTTTPRVSDGTLGFIFVEDLGMVDFYKISFDLFGYDIRGFFKTYFLLVGASLVLLFVTFWSRSGLLLAANLLLFGLFVSICDLGGMRAPSYFASVANGRFFGTLALFPLFHLLILTFAPPHATLRTVVPAILQAFLLALVISMRSSATWGVLGLVASVAVVALWKIKLYWSKRPIGFLFRQIVAWPVAVILVGFVASNIYETTRTNPGYFALSETLPGHYLWHSMAYGLGWFPDIDNQIPGLAGVRGDGLPTYLADSYLKSSIGFVPPSLSAYFASNLFPELGKPRIYERVVRSAYIDFVKRHKLQMLYFTFVTKPWMTLELLANKAIHVVSHSTQFLAGGLLIMLIVPLFLRLTLFDKRDYLFGTMVLTWMGLASCLPSLVAYPAYLGDTFAIVAAMLIALPLITAFRPWSPVTQVVGILRQQPPVTSQGDTQPLRSEHRHTRLFAERSRKRAQRAPRP
jgi:hypothetical protein